MEHLAVLPGDAEDNFGIEPATKLHDKGRQLDGLGARAEDDERLPRTACQCSRARRRRHAAVARTGRLHIRPGSWPRPQAPSKPTFCTHRGARRTLPATTLKDP